MPELSQRTIAALELMIDRSEENSRKVSELWLHVNALHLDVANIKSDCAAIKQRLEDVMTDQGEYVTSVEMEARFKEIEAKIKPLTVIVFGLVATVGVAVIGAVLQLVIRK